MFQYLLACFLLVPMSTAEPLPSHFFAGIGMFGICTSVQKLLSTRRWLKDENKKVGQQMMANSANRKGNGNNDN